MQTYTLPDGRQITGAMAWDSLCALMAPGPVRMLDEMLSTNRGYRIMLETLPDHFGDDKPIVKAILSAAMDYRHRQLTGQGAGGSS